MSEELKPCPFCGGEAVLKSNTLTVGSRHLAFAECSCSTCGTSKAGVSKAGHSGEDAEAMAVERWNRRAERTCRVVPMDMEGNPPYRTGKVVFDSLSDGCSECGYPFDTMYRGTPNYCRNCGARVEEASDDADR